MGVILYQFRYQIDLAYILARYPKLEFEEDLFTNYLEDQNISILTKMPFDNHPDSSPCPTT